ncbi:MAG: hypothetical protein IPO66_23245 [Rhodanobacteraceae bacterium]|nr:hypothetical protein [Rhodanobacteraceae bacterium]
MTIARFLLPCSCCCSAATAPAQSLPDPATATRRVESAVEAVQGSVNNRVTFEGDAATLERLLSDYQSLLSMQQVEQYRGALEAARAEYQRFALAEDLERLDSEVAALETKWQQLATQLGSDELSPNSREGEIGDLRREIERLNAARGKLGGSAADALGERISSVAQAFETTVGGAEAAAELASAREYWERDSAQTVGWEQEQPIDFASYASTRSQASDAFGLPKTLELFQLANSKLAQARENNSPAAYVEQIEAIRVASHSRLLTAVRQLVDAGHALDAGDERTREAMLRLDEALRVTLSAERDPEFQALATRTGQWLKTAADADTSSEEGRARYYERMKVSAAAAWPQMEDQFEAERGFDPTNPGAMEGKLIRVETDNLMGWRFKVGDFPFATTLSGLPVAAIYDPVVAAAIDEVEGKLGRALGDSDDDGRWTIIAQVTGKMGRMQLRKQIEGDIRDSSSGEKLGTYSGEAAESVDAPILRIVAAYVGPLAVSAGVGVAQVDGSLAACWRRAQSGRESGGGTAPFGRFTVLSLLLLGAELLDRRAPGRRPRAGASPHRPRTSIARAHCCRGSVLGSPWPACSGCWPD